ncbi:leucine-rich repeat serine/threonine-protein kinase 1 isoform X1 [Tachysurus ichikawai]
MTYFFNQHTGFISSALTASESDGSLLIEQYAPCPYCNAVLRHTDSVPQTSSTSTTVHYFNMEDCVLAAAEKEHITCPNHPKELVPLQELVPELFMTDFPSR